MALDRGFNFIEHEREWLVEDLESQKTFVWLHSHGVASVLVYACLDAASRLIRHVRWEPTDGA